MALLVLDRYEEDRMIRERRASGNDRYDEVWDGTYVTSPLADVEHQQLSFKLAWVFQNVVGPDSPAIVTAGVNVSDREQGWLQNYRIPDASVTLPGSHARHCGTHFVGGPDFLVEIVSDDDRSRDKLDFYGRIGVRELLVVDRDPWSLELYRLSEGALTSVGTSSPGRPQSLASDVLPVSFLLVAGEPRPKVEIRHADGVQVWSI